MADSLVRTALELKGNPRACAYTEPLWGLSLNLCLPYASVYMLAVGVHDANLGLIISVGMLSQVVFGVLGGVLTDRLGRRRTTAVFDFASWCLPCLIWCAVSLVDARWAFWFFLGASVINGAALVSANSWSCLLVEDANRDQITRLFSLVTVAAQMSAIFAPIAAVLVARFSLVPAVRILYLNAFVVMTVKVVWLYLWSHETTMGVTRMAETAGVPLRKALAGYAGVISMARRSPGTVFSLAIAVIVTAVNTVATTFWPVIVQNKLSVPDPLLPIFAMGRSLIAIVFLFFVAPKLTHATHLARALLIGFFAYAAGQLLVACIPAPHGRAVASTYALLCLCLVFDGVGVGVLGMLMESLIALNVDPQERSRVMAVQRTIIMLAASPFGWVAGLLSSVARNLPFVLTASLLMLGVIVTVAYSRKHPVRPVEQ